MKNQLLLAQADTGKIPTIRIAIILAVLGFTWLIAQRSVTEQKWGLVVIVTIGAFLLLLKWYQFGFLALVFAGLLVPFSIGTGTGTSLNPVVLLLPLLLVLWILDNGLKQKTIKAYAGKPIYLVAALCIVALLSLITGQLPWFQIASAPITAQLGGVSIYIFSFVAFFLAVQHLNRTRLQQLTCLFLAIGTLHVIARLVPALGAIVLRLFAVGSTGSVFWTWLIALATGQLLFHKSLPLFWRLALLLLITSTFVVGWHNRQWASGWFPPLVALFTVLAVRFPRLILPSVIVVGLFLSTRFADIFYVATTEQSWWARQQAWQIVLATSQVNPLLGLGPANYYFYVQLATIGGWGGNWNVAFSSHNNYVDLIAQTGILGLSLFLWFAGTMLHTSWRFYQNLSDEFSQGYTASVLGGLVGTIVSGMLGDWFLPFVYNIGFAGLRSSILFWIFTGGLLALKSQFVNNPSRVTVT
ncbi:MAG: hypothetical protein KC415_00385 [Anaerolineales bacterium]|nr:hypothetical protein [Anaerolineales bacterium]